MNSKFSHECLYTFLDCQCIHDISIHEFFQGLQTMFTTRGSYLHYSGSPSRIIPYLGIQGIQLPFKFMHNTKTIKYFRRGSYQIHSYLVPHRREYLYTSSWLLAPSFLFLPHHQCFIGAFTALSTIFHSQPSPGHSLFEVAHH
jgi:hypothetical protein